MRQYVRGEAQGAPGAQAFAVDRGEVRGEPLEEHVAGPAGPVAAREGVTGEGLGSECLLALQRYDRVVSIDIAGEAAALARAQVAAPEGVRSALLLLLRCGERWDIVALAHCLHPAPALE